MSRETVREHLGEGRLQEAIDAVVILIRQSPKSIELRYWLAELLCVAGDLPRADRILEQVAFFDPSSAPGVGLFRQLIRADQARRQLWSDGRPPDLVVPLDEACVLELRAIVALRAEDRAGAVAALERRDQARDPQPAWVDGVECADFRDIDDTSAAHLDVLTSTGKYVWTPVSQVRAVRFHARRGRRDHLWPRANLTLLNGSGGDVFLPATYTAAEASDREKLGLQTDFSDEGRPVLARGLRMFMTGDAAQTIFDLTTVEFRRGASGDA